MDLMATWLEQQGLEKYRSVFDANDVDPEVLGLSTEGDLEKLGVSLGPISRYPKPAGSKVVSVSPPGWSWSPAVKKAPSARR